MNLFIAMLSNSYTLVQESSDIEWKFSRACLIITYSKYTALPPPINIIGTLINIFKCNNYQIEPENNYQIDIDNNSAKEIITRYNKQPLEILTSDSVNNLQTQINKLSEQVIILTDILSDTNDTDSPYTKKKL